MPLDEQDRSRWNAELIAQGTALLRTALAAGAPGPYQIQAAIAALHDEAPGTDTTDWLQIRQLYERLLEVADSPMARLSRVVATAMVDGPVAGLAELDRLERDPVLRQSHRLMAARAHLHERAGNVRAAVEGYRRAADRTTSTAERNYLLLRSARLEELAGRSEP